jgi:hypothetical protein
MGCAGTDAAFVAGQALAKHPERVVNTDRCYVNTGFAAILEMLLLEAVAGRLEERGSRLTILFK